MQVTPTGRKIARGSNATLNIKKVGYEHQGQYFCVAHNTIKGNRRDDHSRPVALEVLGEFLKFSTQVSCGLPTVLTVIKWDTSPWDVLSY